MPGKTGSAASVLAATALVWGCATAQSESVPSNSASTASRGVTYFLPLRMVKVTATRTPVKIDDLKKAKASTAEAADKAKKAKDEAEAALKLAEARVLKAPTNAELIQARDAAKADFEVKVDALNAASAAAELAAGLLTAAETSSGKCSYSAKLELLPAQADPRHRFVARLHHNWMRDDTLTLKVAPTGLLTSSNAVAVDRAGDIIVEAAGALAGLGGNVPKSLVATAELLESAPERPCASLPKQFIGVFDPVAEGVEQVNADLRRVGFPFRIRRGPINEQLSSGDADWAAFSNRLMARNLPADRTGAIFYRSAAPVLLTLQQSLQPDCRDLETKWNLARAEAEGLKDTPPTAEEQAAGVSAADLARAAEMKARLRLKACLEDDWQDVEAAIVLLPQAGPISYIPMNSRPFVKTVDDVQFADGAIASWTTDRPSEVLEIVRLPVKVLKAAISVPADLISLRVNYSNAERTLADSQRQQMEMENKLRVLKDCIAKAERDQTPASACFPS